MSMKATFHDYGLAAPMEVQDVQILGKWEGSGSFVDWSCPAENIDTLKLLDVRQAGFKFRVEGGICYITARLGNVIFSED